MISLVAAIMAYSAFIVQEILKCSRFKRLLKYIIIDFLDLEENLYVLDNRHLYKALQTNLRLN